jgi:hypothetical protein
LYETFLTLRRIERDIINKTGNVLNSNIDVPSDNQCCSGKAKNIMYPEYVFVALGIHHAPCCIVICGLAGCAIFFHVSYTAPYLK